MRHAHVQTRQYRPPCLSFNSHKAFEFCYVLELAVVLRLCSAAEGNDKGLFLFPLPPREPFLVLFYVPWLRFRQRAVTVSQARRQAGNMIRHTATPEGGMFLQGEQGWGQGTSAKAPAVFSMLQSQPGFVCCFASTHL